MYNDLSVHVTDFPFVNVLKTNYAHLNRGSVNLVDVVRLTNRG